MGRSISSLGGGAGETDSDMKSNMMECGTEQEREERGREEGRGRREKCVEASFLGPFFERAGPSRAGKEKPARVLIV